MGRAKMEAESGREIRIGRRLEDDVPLGDALGVSPPLRPGAELGGFVHSGLAGRGVLGVFESVVHSDGFGGKLLVFGLIPSISK